MIRVAMPDDAEGVHGIYAPIVRDTAISFEWEVPTVEDVRGRITRVLADGFPWLIEESEGGIAGYAYAGRFRARAAYARAVEVSVYVAEGSRGRGVGRMLYRRLLEILELQGFRSAYGIATAPNAGSEALHRSMGFTEVGYFPRVGYKLEAWHDVVCWYKPLGDQAAPPKPIRRLGEVLGALEP